MEYQISPSFILLYRTCQMSQNQWLLSWDLWYLYSLKDSQALNLYVLYCADGSSWLQTIFAWWFWQHPFHWNTTLQQSYQTTHHRYIAQSPWNIVSDLEKIRRVSIYLGGHTFSKFQFHPRASSLSPPLSIFYWLS